MTAHAILEWYRVDRSQSIRRVLVLGACAMATGSLVVGLSFLTRQPEQMRVLAAAIGLAAVVSGPLITLFGLRRSLTEDLYVALRADGVVLHLDEPETFLAWDDIERVRLDAGTIVLAMRSGESLVLARAFAGITTEALAKRLDECRRKAGFHLLK